MPVILKKKERILVFVGIEEYYFPKLANVVLQRFDKNYPEQFTPKNAVVSAIFGHLIEGLNGFPKMSKSIPESSINLDDSYKDLKAKILDCSPADEKIILQMISLVSDWESQKINSALEAFKEKGNNWVDFKKEYLEYFANLKKVWGTAADKNYHFNVRSLFGENHE